MANNSYIFNEQASWLVNWVNVVFTLANPISQIESLRIGYVEYTNFTYSGNTITLADAPSVINWGVFVDYFYTEATNVFSAVNLIYDEVLTWEADWVNKVFTSVYTIDKIDELRIGWVAYTNFTFNWRYVTLVDAPSVISWVPHIDYYRKDVNVNTIESGVTMSSLRSSIYLRIGQTVTSLQFPKELVDEYISEWVRRISKMKVDRRKRGVFSFNKSYDWTVWGTDWSIISVGSTSKYLPSKGVAIIGGNVVYYNWKSTTSITSISWLELSWIEWLKIQYGYKLSRTIGNVSEVFIDGFKLTPCEFSEYRMMKDSDKFCVYNGYLFLPHTVIDWTIVSVIYIWNHNSTYSDSDIIDFDWDYISLLKMFVLYSIYIDREDDRQVKAENEYKKLLREYKRSIATENKTTSAVFQTAWPLNNF